ncbi:unnamed protein product [Arabidopsis halleri]
MYTTLFFVSILQTSVSSSKHCLVSSLAQKQTERLIIVKDIGEKMIDKRSILQQRALKQHEHYVRYVSYSPDPPSA